METSTSWLTLSNATLTVDRKGGECSENSECMSRQEEIYNYMRKSCFNAVQMEKAHREYYCLKKKRREVVWLPLFQLPLPAKEE